MGFKRIKGLHAVKKPYRGLQGLQGVIGYLNGLQGLTRGEIRLQGVTKRLQGVTQNKESYGRGVKRVTRGYRGLEKVTTSYRA